MNKQILFPIIGIFTALSLFPACSNPPKAGQEVSTPVAAPGRMQADTLNASAIKDSTAVQGKTEKGQDGDGDDD